MVKVLGDEIPGAVGQRHSTLLPRLEVAWINGTREIRQGFSGGTQSELDASGGGCLSAVTGSLEHWIDSLWSSLLEL